MDKLPENIGSTNPTPSIIPQDNSSPTDRSVSVPRGYVRMKNDVEWVLRNSIHPQFVQNNNTHQNIKNTQNQKIPTEGDTVNKLKEPYF